MTDSSIPDFNRAEDRRPSANIGYARSATAISFLCLSVWALSPIFPDEIAFRQQLGRVFADDGVVYGLYELCPSNKKTIPLVLEPAAWLLAQAMQIMTPTEMRVLSFAAILAVVFTVVRLVAGSQNPGAGFLVLGSFLGVAGSALIFVRYEFVLELQLLSCLVAAAWLARGRVGVVGDLAVTAGLIVGAALSVWSHLQGLLLLPLTAYLLARLAVRRLGFFGLVAGIVPFILFVPPALTLHHSVCTEHPEIVAHWRSMTLDVSDTGIRSIGEHLIEGARAYINSFFYSRNFPIHFLPGVDTNGFLAIINGLILVVVGSLTVLMLTLPVFLLLRSLGASRFRADKRVLTNLLEKPQLLTIAMLIIIPVLCLFAYDTQHNFYRNFYLNHFLFVASCLVFASLPGPGAARVTKVGCLITGILGGVSLISNVVLFVPPFLTGYEGPSLSVQRNWYHAMRDTDQAAQLCKMNLQQGRIIVDDLTQAGLFTRPVAIPITYLALQSRLIGISAYEAAISVKANYAVLRCPYFDVLGVRPQGKVGEICCYTFN